MIDENKMIHAPKLLKNQEDIPKITKKYVILFDENRYGFTWNNMIQAINLMSEWGWRCINISTSPGSQAIITGRGFYHYALMEKM